MKFTELAGVRVAVIGLGYVGLPLAIEFSRKYPTRGFDISAKRIDALRAHRDVTREVSSVELANAKNLSLTTNARDLSDCNVYIVTVPTPIDDHKRPNMAALRAASHTVATVINPGDAVIFESTVYPGATEEVCIPIIEAQSGLKLNEDFVAGYSPERINPGDSTHRLVDIVKVTSGSSTEAAAFVDALYASIIVAGTHPAPSIRVAEAAKVIENTQRDLNIALINELALIFERLGIDTEDVLAAAATKWNFLPFRPGLVGGHCIGVDPYYLTFKAQEIGYHPEVILAGRRINDAMGERVADRVVKLMARDGIHIGRSRVLVMGLAFKENCPDIRNTRAIDIVRALEGYSVTVDVHDPWVDGDEVRAEFTLNLVEHPHSETYDAIVIAVGHQQFRAMGAARIRDLGKPGCVIFDVKHVLPKECSSGRL